jgi:hypothetical protein
VSKNWDCNHRKKEPAWDIQPHVAGYMYATHIDRRNHKHDGNDELDKHTEDEKSPTVHQLIFSGAHANGKEKGTQTNLQI